MWPVCAYSRGDQASKPTVQHSIGCALGTSRRAVLLIRMIVEVRCVQVWVVPTASHKALPG